MAGAGYKLFNTGDVLTAAQVNTYLMQQTVMVFASSAARTSALSGVLAEGMVSYLQDTNTLEVYDGSAWVGATGDITGLTAGTGISISSATGPVPTITSDVATTFDAKGDLVVGTGADTFAKLTVGNSGETIVADSSASTGLRWQTGVNSNSVINGGMDIWQRGTSFTLASSTYTYTADRWSCIRLATGMTVSRQTASLDGFTYSLRAQRDSGNTSTATLYLQHNLENDDSARFAGKTITLSFWAKAGANYSPTSSNLSLEWATGTGTNQTILTGFTGQTALYNNSFPITTSWQRFTFTATTASSMKQIGFIISAAPTGTAGVNDWFEITGVQLELGSRATEFKRAGNTLAGELAACQRYYYRVQANGTNSYATFGMAYATGATNANLVINFPSQMRQGPNSVSYGGTVKFQDYSGTQGTVTAMAINVGASTTQVAIVENTISGATAGRIGQVAAIADATAFIALSAEL